MKLLLTGDWHIRDDVPVCRTDVDFFATMMQKVRFVVQTAIDRGVTAIIHAGDLFDRGRPVQSQMLEIELMEALKPLHKEAIHFLAVPGNHDLPYHSMKELERSSFGVMCRSGYVQNLHDVSFRQEGLEVVGVGWGYELEDTTWVVKGLHVGVWHGLVTKTSGEIPGSLSAENVLRKNKGYDLIVTGDNHQQILEKVDSRLLVNPGSLLRMSIDEVDFEPVVFLYDSEDKSLEKIRVPIQQSVISREHKDLVEARDQKIAAFVESMRTDYEVGLSFEKNLEEYIRENGTPKPVEELVWEVVGG